MILRRKRNIHTTPGSIVFTGQKKVENVTIHYLSYNKNSFKEETHHVVANPVFHALENDYIQWYDIRGIHDVDLIASIGKHYNVHPLIQEDIVDVYQRPKFDESPENGFIICHALDFQNQIVVKENVSIYFGKGFLISFQENETDLFEGIRNRIRQDKGKVREMNTDYLAYALLDHIIDKYFIVVDSMNEYTQELEELIIKNPENLEKSSLQQLKRNNQRVKRSIHPLRETISQFLQSETDYVDEKTRIYIRDLRTNLMHLLDMLENNRDIVFGLQDLYLSELNFKMNKVIQVLTVVTTIFVPLTFIVGIYGMNFDHMPELHWRYGYFIILLFMLLISVGAILFIRSRKWLH